MVQLSLGNNVTINETDFGDVAKKIMGNFFEKKRSNQKGSISTTKLRSILEMVNYTYYSVLYIANNELTNEHLSSIAYLKVRMAYESGREDTVRDFIKEAGLMEPITDIVKSKRRDSFLLYCRYVESLVAYYKYEGGNY